MACGRCNSTSKNVMWVYKSPDGKTTSMGSEAEAKAKVARSGGSYTKK